MKKKIVQKIVSMSKKYFFLGVFFFVPAIVFSATSQFKIEIISVCGNGIIELNEQCDAGNLGFSTCQTRGFSGGILTCNANCSFNVNQCTTISPGGGGGGGGPSESNQDETQVTFSGRAYPLSRVGLLKDGNLVVTTIAGPDARFNLSLKGLSVGNYLFSIYGEDQKGKRSNLFTFSVFVTAGAATNVSGIFIAPTISVDKSQVKRGDDLIIFGQTTPDAMVNLEINSENQIFVGTKTDKDGAFLYTFDTSSLHEGSHSTKAKTNKEGEVSSPSLTAGFLVGDKNIFIDPKTQVKIKGDLNGDKKVNLIDFSIAAFWYQRSLSGQIKLIEIESLNGDGAINLVDFSIISYYWTG